MEETADEFGLEAIAHLHGIATATLIPYTVVRLLSRKQPTEATLRVQLRDIGDETKTERHMRMMWSSASAPALPLAVQDNSLTERAALGLACVIVWLYGGLRFRAVAAPGDRFDLWATDGERHYGVEVSGTMTEELEARHREKVAQLRENPYGVDGYVVVVSFTMRTAIFSFQRFKEHEE